MTAEEGPGQTHQQCRSWDWVREHDPEELEKVINEYVNR